MKTKLNAILEIGCEEMPARFMPGFLKDLKEKAEEKFKKERLDFSKIETLGTYRRLALFIEGIAPKQKDLSEGKKGPPVERAYDASGNPTQAAIGFAKSLGLEVSDLEVKEEKGKKYVFAKVFEKGKPSEEVLASIFPQIISSLYQPLSMRWGDLDFKFIRPIHWILALCGNKVVKFELAGVKSGDKTEGHRYHTKLKNQKLKFKNVELLLYKKTLNKIGVIIDQKERKESIQKQIITEAKRAGVGAIIEDDLLEEVTYLVENPKAYIGSFDPAFLDIPQEVLITSMKKNQKYFPLMDKSNKLMPKFIVISDGCQNSQIIVGNQKVLSARLSDAKFFFEEDKKIPLKMRVPELEKIAFFEKLGMLSEKVGRMAKLAEWIGKHMGLIEEEIISCQRIAQLCKTDLTTKMVYEFPVLQGVMGKEYALLNGEDKKVAQGIFEHYLPRFAEDILPESKEGIVLALADRIDSIVGCFCVGAIPTGSADPYGLRRAAHGIIRIILEKKIDLLLDEVLEHSYKLYEPVFLKYLFEKGETGYQDYVKIKQQIIDFLAARLRPLLLEKGFRYDVVDAVLADLNDVLDCVEKAESLNKHVSDSYFKNIVLSADRVSRIAKDALREKVIEDQLIEEEEKKLYEYYLKINWEAGEAINAGNWEKALEMLSKLSDPIEAFFDKVLVMHKEENLKINRLALLKLLEKLYLSVADFRKIVVQ